MQVQAQQLAARQQAQAISASQGRPDYRLPEVRLPQKGPIPRWVVASAALGLVVVLGSTLWLVMKARSR